MRVPSRARAIELFLAPGLCGSLSGLECEVFSGCVSPEGFEVVILADRVQKDVHDNVAVIGKNPCAFYHALNVMCNDFLLFQPEQDFLCYRLDADYGPAATDHKKIGDTREIPKIQQEYIVAFLAFRNPARFLRQR